MFIVSADRPAKLAPAPAYSRTNIGVHVVGQSGSRLYGVDDATGRWVTSDDNGETWDDQGRAPTQDFGAGRRVSQLVIGNGVQLALAIVADANGVATTTASLWRAQENVFDSWTNVTPSNQPSSTIGRNDLLVWTGSAWLYGNYHVTGNPGVGCFIWRSVDNGTNWTTPLVKPGARHVHGIFPLPANPAEVYVNLGEVGGDAGTYYSDDHGATWVLVDGSRKTPIIMDTLVDGSVVGEGDGILDPHLFVLRDNRWMSLIYPDTNPPDGLGSWQGTTRAIKRTSEGNLFYMTTAELGVVGTRYGIWLARGPDCRQAVLLEEIDGWWTAPMSRYGKTYEAGPYLYNANMRMVRPRFIGQ